VAGSGRDACRAARIDDTESPELFDLRMECRARSIERVRALVRELAHPTPILVDGALDAVARATDLAPCHSRRELLAPHHAPADPALRGRLATITASEFAGRYADAARDAAAIAETAVRVGLRDVEAEAWELVGRADAAAQVSVAARDAYHKALVAAEAAGDARRRIVLYLLLVDVEIDLERYREAAQWAAQAHALSDHLGDPSLRWRILSADAAAATNEDPVRAVKLLREAIVLRGDPSDVESVSLQRALGAALWRNGDRAEAKRTFEHALALGEKLLGPNHPQLIETLSALGMAAGAMKQPADGLPYLERAFAIAEATAGREHAQLPRTAFALAAEYGEQMRVTDSIAVLDRTLSAYKRAYADEAPLARLLTLRAEMLALDGLLANDPRAGKAEIERALADRLEATSIQRRSLPADSTELAEGLERLGRIQCFADKPADAIRSYEEALAIRARIAGATPDATFAAELGLGGALDQANRAVEGIPHLEKALAIAEARGLFGGATDVADSKAALGAALVDLHRDRARAIALLRAARSVYVAIGEPHDVKEVTDKLASIGAK
jgi:tetratricopeptide (TPR) repeat protein